MEQTRELLTNVSRRQSLKAGDIVKKAITLFVSIVLAATVFVPFLGIDMTIDGEKIKCGVMSPADASVIFFDSLKNLSYDEVEDTDIYDELSDMEDEIDEFDVEDDDEFEEVKPYIKKAARLCIRAEAIMEYSGYKVIYMASGIFAIMYILAVISFLAFSVIGFVSLFKDIKSFDNILFFNLISIMGTQIALGFLLKNYCSSFIENICFKLTSWYVISLIIVASTIIYCTVSCALKNKTADGGKPVKVLNIISVALATVIVILSVSPAFTMTVKGDFDGDERKVEFNIAERVYSYVLTEEEEKTEWEAEDYKDMVVYLLKYVGHAKPKEIKKGLYDNRAAIIAEMLMYDCGSEARYMGIGLLVQLAAILLSVFVLACSLLRLMGYNNKLLIIADIADIVLLLSLVCIIVGGAVSAWMITDAAKALKIKAEEGYLIGAKVNAGLIVAAVFNIALIVLNAVSGAKAKRKKNEISEITEPQSSPSFIEMM